MAVNCSWRSWAIEGLAAVTAIDVKGAVTVSVAPRLDAPPSVAVMVVVPVVRVVARPCVPAALEIVVAVPEGQARPQPRAGA